MDEFIRLLIIVGVLLVLWYFVAKFSPDPLITKICQIVIFIAGIVIVLRLLLPYAGVSF